MSINQLFKEDPVSEYLNPYVNNINVYKNASVGETLTAKNIEAENFNVQNLSVDTLNVKNKQNITDGVKNALEVVSDNIINYPSLKLRAKNSDISVIAGVGDLGKAYIEGWDDDLDQADDLYACRDANFNIGRSNSVFYKTSVDGSIHLVGDKPNISGIGLYINDHKVTDRTINVGGHLIGPINLPALTTMYYWVYNPAQDGQTIVSIDFIMFNTTGARFNVRVRNNTTGQDLFYNENYPNVNSPTIFTFNNFANMPTSKCVLQFDVGGYLSAGIFYMSGLKVTYKWD